MLEDSHAHLKHQELSWHKDKREIVARPVNVASSYLLITNSVQLAFDAPKVEEEHCGQCKEKITGLVFALKKIDLTKEALQQEMQGLKYCLVEFDKASGKIEQVIGYHNIFNQRKSILITQNLVVSSEKAEKESQVDRALYYTAHSSKEIQQDFQQENLSSSVVFSLQKDVEVIEKYEVYVAKLQSQVEESYGNNMFYEYAWTDSQIEDIMKKIEHYLGPIHSLVPRRRYLCFTFSKNKNDCYFKNKYEAIGREILLRQTNKVEGNFLNYYLVSRQQLLKNQEQTAKLFLLPNNERITDMIMLDQWIIIAAETYLLSVHSQRPMEYFHHQENINPTKLTMHHTNNKVFFAAGRKGSIYRFQLQQMKIVLTGKYQIPFVKPFSMVHLQTGMTIGGIDFEPSRSSSSKTHKRSIFLVKTDGKPEKSKQIGFEVRLEIVVLKNNEFDKPIRNIISTKQTDVVACNWHNKFYLVSLKGLKLIEVELKLSIVKMIFVPFLFNHLNFLLLAENGQIIRIGIQSYGESLGAELNPVKACNSKDLLLVEDGKAKFQIYSCEGNRIDRISYLTQAKKAFLNEQSGKILKIASSNCGLAYLVDLQHSIQLKFLQV